MKRQINRSESDSQIKKELSELDNPFPTGDTPVHIGHFRYSFTKIVIFPEFANYVQILASLLTDKAKRSSQGASSSSKRPSAARRLKYTTVTGSTCSENTPKVRQIPTFFRVPVALL